MSRSKKCLPCRQKIICQKGLTVVRYCTNHFINLLFLTPISHNPTIFSQVPQITNDGQETVIFGTNMTDTFCFISSCTLFLKSTFFLAIIFWDTLYLVKQVSYWNYKEKPNFQPPMIILNIKLHMTYICNNFILTAI